MTLNSPLQPWMRGPFELIKHANGHLLDGGDTDRRIALIGFDNSIEVCIDVYLNLHPRLRNGIEITNEDKKKAANNYHTKIEFLDKFVQEQKVTLSTTIEAVVWYHQLRNELYHSGNGMIPEMHAIEGARNATIAVFEALFRVNIIPLLEDKSIPAQPDNRDQHIPEMQIKPEMEFLRIFIEFEKTLRDIIESNRTDSLRTKFSTGRLWEVYINSAKIPINNADNAFMKRILDARNHIAHGEALEIQEDELQELGIKLSELTNKIRLAEQK